MFTHVQLPRQTGDCRLTAKQKPLDPFKRTRITCLLIKNQKTKLWLVTCEQKEKEKKKEMLRLTFAFKSPPIGTV